MPAKQPASHPELLECISLWNKKQEMRRRPPVAREERIANGGERFTDNRPVACTGKE